MVEMSILDVKAAHTTMVSTLHQLVGQKEDAVNLHCLSRDRNGCI